jgi:hypothetical protein
MEELRELLKEKANNKARKPEYEQQRQTGTKEKKTENPQS